MKKLLKNHDEEEKQEDTLMDKINTYLLIPVEAIQMCTCFPGDKDDFDKGLCYLSSIGGTIFFFWVFNQTGFFSAGYQQIMFGCALVIFLIIYKTLRDLKEGELPKYFVALNVVSTIQGLVWSYIVSAYLIDLLTCIGVLAKLDTTYLGLTILALGNALPDGLTVIALSDKGLAVMGISGVYAGQLFGLLVGFGLAMLRKTLSIGSVQFLFFNKESILDILVVGIILITLVFSFIYGIINDYVFDKKMAYILGSIYLLFIISATGYQIFEIINN